MAVTANCPGCGGPVSFRFQTSVVNVCGYCRTVVARTDRAFENLGKLSDVVDTESPLTVDMQGMFAGVPFQLTGRAQVQHPMGGVWDEWYVNFADGRLGWLAEAQGKFFLTFEQQPPPGLPAFQQVGPGMPLPQLGHGFVVAERNAAKLVAAVGEIPYKLVPGTAYYFVDVSGPTGAFVTLDYSDGPVRLYAGREVTLQDLGVAAKAAAGRDARVVKAAAMKCPNCGGSFELRAPDAAMRVTCPYCRALSDVQQGNLQFLRTLDPPVQPDIPLGTQGTLEPGGPKMTVIGFVIRSVNFDGIRYPWCEFLLYEKTLGFRWLVESDGHWSWVSPVAVADVMVGHVVTYGGKTFKPFQYAFATADHVEGEFYWRVEAGETVVMTDYVAPPRQLSCEQNENEINWSVADYKTKDEVEKAFGVKLPRGPVGVAPNQPFVPAQTYKFAALFLLLSFLIMVVHSVGCSPNDQVVDKTLALEPQRSAQEAQFFFLDGVKLSGRNLRIEVDMPALSNSWADISGDLVELDTGMTTPFDLPVEYYSGYDDGHWTEGSTRKSVVLGKHPAGNYMLRLGVLREGAMRPGNIRVQLYEGVPRPGRFALIFFLLALPPLFVGLWHYSFNRRRWANSDFNPYQPQEGEE